VLLARWHGTLGRTIIVRAQMMLVALAVAISLQVPAELMMHAAGHAFSPLRLSLGGSAGVLACGLFLYRELFAAQLSAVALLAASLGNTPGDIRAHAAAIARAIGRGGVRLIPDTPMQWGVAAVIGSFVMLAFGALLSLRKHAPENIVQVAGDEPPL